MSFEQQLKDVFDIDIWDLKPQYKIAEPQENIEIQEEVSINDNQPVMDKSQLLYSNGKESSKIINIFIKNTANIAFYKNIFNSLFFESKVNFYQTNNASLDECDGINFFEEDFILRDVELLSVQSKKYILSKLYEHADFAIR